jgi:hypothetical protein
LASVLSEEGGQYIHGRLLDYLLIKRYKAKFPDSNIYNRSEDANRRYDMVSYIESLNKRLFENEENSFLFHSPGAQIDTFLAAIKPPHSAKVVLMLRHPMQNYMSIVYHYLQKGGGYANPEILQPYLGLPSILHIAFLHLLRAFYVAARFQDDERVLCSKLEDFTSDPEERQRVWDFLEIPHHPTLEMTTRLGEAEAAYSGIWKSSNIKKVTTDLNEQPLTEKEFMLFKQYSNLFAPYYPDALSNLEVVLNNEAEEIFYNREAHCLTTNRHALEQRDKRLAAVWNDKPRGIRAMIKWPRRVLKTFKADKWYYPHVQMKRTAADYANLHDGFDVVPELVGLEKPFSDS